MPSVIDRLAAHRAIGGVPRPQLEWLAAHGELRKYHVGDVVIRRGEISAELVVMLSGVMAVYIDRGSGRRRMLEWRGGEVTGMLPYSRMGGSPGDGVIEVEAEALSVPVSLFPEMIRDCPDLIAVLVHTMTDRARQFTSYDLRDEKMRSLGRLSAGLAHELNNPASAIVRSAADLGGRVAELDRAAQALGAAGLSPDESAAVEGVRRECLGTVRAGVRSPVEQADHEDAIADWLDEHAADPNTASALAESEVTLEALDRLARDLDGPKLDAALRAIAAGCTVRILARDIEAAASRMSHLVGAVKGYTHMDQTSAAQVDLARGLADTVTVHQSKAKAKSIGVTVDVPADVPPVVGFGGELNQVWANLLENALDAAPEAGRVVVSARRVSRGVAVSVEDDGPGVPDALRHKIFDPFFTTKAVGSGTGLGLDMAQRIVNEHGGDISLESRPGRTVFTVTLPIR